MVVGKSPESMEVDPADGQVGDVVTVPLTAEELFLEEMQSHAKLVDKYVTTKETRFMHRILRSLVKTRSQVTVDAIVRVIDAFYSNDADLSTGEQLKDFLGSSESKLPPLVLHRPITMSPELDGYVHLLVLIHLIDIKKLDKALLCADSLMSKLELVKARTMDPIRAKSFFYFSRAHELGAELMSIQHTLHSKFRTCTLKNDYDGQAVLINCILRYYVVNNLYGQASQFLKNMTFPDSANINEWARYLYYLGRVQAIQLKYTDSHKSLVQALRKSPQTTAIGFKQTVQKLAIIVELLLGEMPDRSIFREEGLRYCLQPYFLLTQAVRRGEIIQFNEVVKLHQEQFVKDDMITLIVRLRHNVIKTGLKRINQSYSRISLLDISHKLNIESTLDTEYMVAKAINDGVINAVIDHAGQFMISKEGDNVYMTGEPQSAFHERVQFCLDIHNQSVRAMRFPPKSYQWDLDTEVSKHEEKVRKLMNMSDEDFDDEDDEFFDMDD